MQPSKKPLLLATTVTIVAVLMAFLAGTIVSTPTTKDSNIGEDAAARVNRVPNFLESIAIGDKVGVSKSSPKGSVDSIAIGDKIQVQINECGPDALVEGVPQGYVLQGSRIAIIFHRTINVDPKYKPLTDDMLGCTFKPAFEDIHSRYPAYAKQCLRDEWAMLGCQAGPPISLRLDWNIPPHMSAKDLHWFITVLKPEGRESRGAGDRFEQGYWTYVTYEGNRYHVILNMFYVRP